MNPKVIVLASNITMTMEQMNAKNVPIDARIVLEIQLLVICVLETIEKQIVLVLIYTTMTQFLKIVCLVYRLVKIVICKVAFHVEGIEFSMTFFVIVHQVGNLSLGQIIVTLVPIQWFMLILQKIISW